MKNKILIPLVILALLPLNGCSNAASKDKDHDEYILDSVYHWKEDDEENKQKHSYFSNGECKTCNWNKEYSNFYYSRNNEEETITGYKGKKEIVEIPNIKYGGRPITRVYIQSAKIVSLKLSDTIRYINMEGNPYIETITNVNKDLEVEIAGFRNCYKFSGFDGKIGKFGISSFVNSAISHIELSEDSELTSIPQEAFQNTKLINVNFNNIKSVGIDAFNGCTNLKSATFTLDEESYFSIGDNSFAGCTALSNFSFPSNATKLYLGKECFKDCTSLTSINITAETFSTYGYGNQFDGCTNLQTINTDKIKYYMPFMFLNSGIKSLSLADNVVIYKRAFQDIEEVTSPSYGFIKTYYDGTTSNEPFHSNAFSSSTLKKVTFGEKLYSTYFSDYLFEGSSYLENITIPDGIETLGEGCFDGCNRFKSVVLPTSIKQIKKNCFIDTNCTGFDYNTNKFIYDNIDVFYKGDETSWKQVKVESGVSGNGVDSTTKEQIYFDFHNFKMFYYSETKPTDSSLNYWHYDNGIVTKW